MNPTGRDRLVSQVHDPPAEEGERPERRGGAGLRPLGPRDLCTGDPDPRAGQ